MNQSIDFSNYDLLLLDLVLEDDGSVDKGLEAVTIVKKRMPLLPILILTSHASTEFVSDAFKRGVSDFLEKPVHFTKDFYELKLLPTMFNTIDNSVEKDWEHIISIINSLKEDELIVKIILPLLRALGFTNVRKIGHHGPGEFGRDVLPFFKYDEFMQKIFYAVQVKTGNITARNINSLLDQAKTALSVSFIDTYDNKRKRIDKAVIIFSGTLTADASRILEENLESNPHIVFIDNNRLFELLRQNNLIYLIESERASNRVVIIPCILSSDSTQLAYSRKDVLEKLAFTACEFADLSPVPILPLFYQREELGSTSIGNYWAVPHITAFGNRLHYVFIVHSNFPIIWSDKDKEPVYVIGMCIFRSDSSPINKYKILASIASHCKKLTYKPVEHTRQGKLYLEKMSDSIIAELTASGFKIEKENFIHINF